MTFRKKIKKIKGDASLRVFYRKKTKNKTSIIIYSNKERRRNLLIYDAVNKILLKNHIIAPKLLSEKYSRNYIEIEDFGNDTIFNILKRKKVNKFKMFRKIIFLIFKLQSIKEKKIKDFQNKNYIIPKYSSKILLKEAKLFSDWYVKNAIKKNQYLDFKKEYIKIIKKLITQIKLKNNVFVHRDFHVSNMMSFKNKIGIIDTQDALIGNQAYDLASLIDDVRYKTSTNFKKQIFNLYLDLSKKKINQNKFKNDFEIISVLRNLKIIGIFTRLAIRDKKKKYLKLIPYAWSLIKLRSSDNKKFEDLSILLNNTFQKY